MHKYLKIRIKEVRVKKGSSQSDLANAVGIYYTQIGRYENKGAQPAVSWFSKLYRYVYAVIYTMY